MKTNQEVRMETMRNLMKDSLLSKGSILLSESVDDSDITQEEHKQLFMLFLNKVEMCIPSPKGPELFMIKHICITKHSKGDIKMEAKKIGKLREHLQRQIDVGDIYDASGKIIPETLWGMICLMHPELKGKYDLESEYDGEKDPSLRFSIIDVSSRLAIWSDKTKHLRR